MSCLLVPLAEGIVVSALDKLVIHSEHSSQENADGLSASFKANLGKLKTMLYGGSFLLGVDHVFNGEISFVPPFLTALNSPEETSVMLKEIATTGVAMALAATFVWGCGVVISWCLKKSRVHKAKSFARA